MERVEKQRGDLVLLLLLVVILGTGLAFLFSASYVFSGRAFKDPLFLLKRQLVWAGIGAAAAFVVSFTPLEALRRWIPLILLGTLAAVFLPFVPRLGTAVLGSRRWITAFGFSIQPSELVKLTLILYLASYFARREDGEGLTLNSLIAPFIVTSVFAGIILVQNDYSTAIFVLVIGLAMMFVSEVNALHVLLVTLLAVPLGFLLLFTREHRVQRLLAFFDLSSHSEGTGYQIVTAKAAIVSGGLFGRGLGRSVAKLGPLPIPCSCWRCSACWRGAATASRCARRTGFPATWPSA
jgi:cell division protein FtsW